MDFPRLPTIAAWNCKRGSHSERDTRYHTIKAQRTVMALHISAADADLRAVCSGAGTAQFGY